MMRSNAVSAFLLSAATLAFVVCGQAHAQDHEIHGFPDDSSASVSNVDLNVATPAPPPANDRLLTPTDASGATGAVNPRQLPPRESLVDAGSLLVSGAVSFTSQGGDLYVDSDPFFDDEDAGDRATTVAIVPSIFYFVIPGLGVGADLSYNRTSQGDFSFTFIGVGPKVGYFFDTGSDFIPYLSAGFNFLSLSAGFGNESESESGSRIKLGGGLLFPLSRAAIVVEAGYMIDRFKMEGFDQSVTGNTIAIGIGLAGFLP